MREGQLMSSILQDLRYAARGLAKTPGFTVAVVLTLALGIGANTALFSILNGLLLKPLPVRDPERLVLIDGEVGTNPIWEEIRRRQHEMFDSAFAWSAEAFDVSEQSQTEFVDGVYASGGMFDVLGVSAVRGRTFSAADDRRGGGLDGAIVVISHGFWQRRLGGAEDVIGRRLMVNRVPFTIVGVAPSGFFGPDVGRAAHIFVPLAGEALIKGEDSSLDCRSCWWLNVMARLKPGQTVRHASAILHGVQAQIREATMPNSVDGRGSYMSAAIDVVPAATGRSTLRERYRQPLVIIMAVVGAVLLIACANVANLLLARTLTRRHELALKLTLGASRWRVARQLLIESGLLSIVGAALGLFVAHVGSAMLVGGLGTPSDVVFLDTSIDWRVMTYTTGLALLAALLFGLAPGLGVGRFSLHAVLKEQGRGVGGERHSGVRNALVVIQVALSLLLVVAAGIFMQTFAGLKAVPLGFDPDPLVVLDVNTQRSAMPGAERSVLFERFRQASLAVPGVRQAALSYIRPLSGSGWNTGIEPVNGARLSRRDRMAWVNPVSPGWFETYGIRMVSGRDFTSADRGRAALVAIVNESFVRRFLRDRNPIDAEFRSTIVTANATYRVIGVVSDAVYRRLREGVLPTVYVPLSHIEELGPEITIAAKVTPDAVNELARALMENLAGVDPAATFTPQPYDRRLHESVTRERVVALLSSVFGALALLLAAVGLYGVASYSVNRRRAEIGLRMALGADGGKVARLVVGRVAALVIAGIVLGGGLSWWASRFVAPSLLYGLEARDPMTFIIAAVVLTTAGALAGWLPARRATRIDPAQALRES
jgi:putative ABC transport system permease protein